MLNMPKHDKVWHEQDMKDELAELEAEKSNDIKAGKKLTRHYGDPSLLKQPLRIEELKKVVNIDE